MVYRKDRGRGRGRGRGRVRRAVAGKEREGGRDRRREDYYMYTRIVPRPSLIPQHKHACMHAHVLVSMFWSVEWGVPATKLSQ